MEELVTTQMPFSHLAEQSVIGSAILNKEIIATLAHMLKPQDFYMPAHSEIYDAVLDLFNEDQPIDVVTLTAQLEQRGSFEKIGGLSYLVEIANSVPTAANYRNYAKIVAEKAVLRNLINASGEITRVSYAGEDEVEDILRLAETRIFDILEKRELQNLVHIDDVLSANFQNLLELFANPENLVGVPTGFVKLDATLGGLKKGNLVLVAARPGMGKTSFALNIAQHAAQKKKQPVAIFSLEMTKEEITNRLWSAETMVNAGKVEKANLSDREWEQLTEGMEILSKIPIYIDDTGGATVTDVRTKCRRLQREQGLGLIIIDHLQLMGTTKRSENRQQEISYISRTLKMLAKDLNVPIVLLSQLNRASEARKGNRPVLSDLRESGAIEQDADVVMLLYRDDYYNEDSEQPGIAECIIAKNRSGETKTIKLKWQGEFTRFKDLDTNEYN